MSTIQRAVYCKLCANIAHNLQFTQCQLCSRTYPMYLQLRIFRIQYSAEHIPNAIGDISKIQCALYCKHGTKYSAHPTDCAMWTVVPAIYNELTAPHIQASILNWTYVRRYLRYIANSMRLILQTWSQIQRTSSTLLNVDCGPGHMQCDYSPSFSVINIQLNVSPPLFEVCRQFTERYTANLVPYIAHTLQFTLCELWSRTYTM
jgi:hypothetical protein